MKKTASVLLVAMLGMFGMAAHAAPVVILSGEVNGQGPGSLIEESTVISLPAGAMLIFNDATGQTKTLAGPFEGPINGEQTTSGETSSGLDRLITSHSAEQSRLGAIRSLPGQVPRDPDVISVAQSSVQCLPMNGKAELWRPSTLNVDSFFSVSHAETSVRAKSVWHADVERIAWPSEVPVVSGGRYLIELEVAPRPVEITLYIAPQKFASDAELASWMGQVGCRRQAYVVLKRVAN